MFVHAARRCRGIDSAWLRAPPLQGAARLHQCLELCLVPGGVAGQQPAEQRRSEPHRPGGPQAHAADQPTRAGTDRFDELARAAGISEVLRAAALADDELRSIHRRHDDLQVAGYRQVIEITADKHPLRPGHTIDSATDVLLLLCGDHTYVSLIERGWTHDQIVNWLAETVPALLLATPSFE